MRIPGRPLRACLQSAGLAAGIAALSGAQALAAPPELAVAATEMRALQAYYTTSGTAAASLQVDLVARVPGYLRAADAADGTRVGEGDELFLIEPEPYRAQLGQAQAALDSARAQLAYAETQLARQKALRARDVTDQSSLDQAQATRDEAAAAEKNAEAGLRTAELELGYTSVRAPFGGVMAARTADPGAYVGANGAQTLATLYQTDPIEVQFTVSETDMLRLRAALRAEGLPFPGTGPVRIEAGTGRGGGDYPLAGSVSYLAPAATEGTGTFALRATFANPDGAVMPGTFVRLRLPLGPPRPRMLVPTAAIGTDLQGRYVLAVEDGVLRRVAVEPGPAQGGMTELETPVETGEGVAANVAAAPPAGTAVTPRPAAGADSDSGS
ncbi:efflux RND transporter periplasmic adaptor subunit [Poseidonocella sp. HB161398]|uniref:efflux RND transporter periplasmic adaptor subunit n=1 Tax=Poseidonocella sp. HB161398 TaxID=2320855 RepID=UPI00110826D9|nr:efflux RND transporter periplasmic adaptor subunit [Poseidonocella sp. HB161398]